MPEVLQAVTGWVTPFLAGDPQGTAEAVERALAAFYDPEAHFIYSLVLFRVDQVDRGLEVLRDSVAGGFNPAGALGDEAAFDPVRGQATFEGLRRTVDERRAEALATYRSAGGERLLGL
jgi:hypothetical protein